jgi:TrmH family RNA methyltransferase
MITSPQNPTIKRIRHLQKRSKAREEEGAFVIEGLRLVEEALQHAWAPEVVLFTEDIDQRGWDVINGFRGQGVPTQHVSPEVMSAASDTQTPQGLLAVLPLKGQPRPQKLDFVLVADQVRDPGNLGTLLRTALAAGVDAVYLTPGTVDPHAPKVVRAGMGAHFQLPVAKKAWGEIEEEIKGLYVYIADAKKGIPHTEADLTEPLALIIGNEARGPGRRAWALADQPLHIPMPGDAESLNAAIAGAILIFEVVRQRNTP